jgi:hypothetical protein
MSRALHIHAGAEYYLERAEPEQTIQGVLRERPVRTGPDTRDLPLHLETDEGTIAIYAVGATAELLRDLTDRRVRVLGKRVDQRSEGHGLEIWPATVEAVTD